MRDRSCPSADIWIKTSLNHNDSVDLPFGSPDFVEHDVGYIPRDIVEISSARVGEHHRCASDCSLNLSTANAQGSLQSLKSRLI